MTGDRENDRDNRKIVGLGCPGKDIYISTVLKNHLIFHHAFKTFWKRHKKGRSEIYVFDTTIRSSFLGFVTGVVYWFFHEGVV